MRFWTIWTIPRMAFAERLRRTRDCFALAIARHLPLRIRYWTTLIEIGRATSTSENIPATPLNEILKNLETPKVLS